MARNTEKHAKRYTNLQDLEYSEKQRKTGNMRNAQFRTLILAKTLKNVENETQTQFDLEYGEKHSKAWKMRNTHFRTGHRAKNSEKLGK